MKKRINSARKIRINLTDLNTNKQFTGDEDHHISLKEASEMTRAYRKNHPNETKAHFFGRKILLEILNQKDCVGIRIYYANDPNTGNKDLVIVGVDAEMNDLERGVLGDRSKPCPNYCSKPNVLNA